MSNIVAVVTDLFFQSRIIAAAKAQNVEVKLLVQGVDAAAVEPESLALVDLDARLDVLATISLLKNQLSCTVVAFGPHLDGERLKAARAAGADRVLAKSKFVAELPNLAASMKKRQNAARQTLQGVEDASDFQ